MAEASLLCEGFLQRRRERPDILDQCHIRLIARAWTGCLCSRDIMKGGKAIYKSHAPPFAFCRGLETLAQPILILVAYMPDLTLFNKDQEGIFLNAGHKLVSGQYYFFCLPWYVLLMHLGYRFCHSSSK